MLFFSCDLQESLFLNRTRDDRDKRGSSSDCFMEIAGHEDHINKENLNMAENYGGYGGEGGDREGDHEDGTAEEFEKKVFVGGVSWQTTEDGLKYYFIKFGEITDVALMKDRSSGKPRGFAFVTFKDPSCKCLTFVLLFIV